VCRRRSGNHHDVRISFHPAATRRFAQLPLHSITVHGIAETPPYRESEANLALVAALACTSHPNDERAKGKRLAVPIDGGKVLATFEPLLTAHERTAAPPVITI
jgi:hypothetical protein